MGLNLQNCYQMCGLAFQALAPQNTACSGSSTLIGFAALPTELFIFEPLLPHRPRYKCSDRLIGLADGTEFLRDLEASANLRLACVTWNQIMTPMLYDEVIIFTHPFSRLQRMVRAFEYGAPHTRSMVLYGSGGNDFIVPKMAEALIM